jgi:hypothetical protein
LVGTQLTLPGTPLLQETFGASAVDSSPANAETTGDAARRHTARMAHAFRIDLNFNLLPAPRE